VVQKGEERSISKEKERIEEREKVRYSAHMWLRKRKRA
jgi:hypothetical protein